jgi:hypothetical protein
LEIYWAKGLTFSCGTAACLIVFSPAAGEDLHLVPTSSEAPSDFPTRWRDPQGTLRIIRDNSGFEGLL